MGAIRFTKMGLRDEQVRLKQLETYLPTLRLKKLMIQIELNHAQLEIVAQTKKMQKAKEEVEAFALLFDQKYGRTPLLYCQVLHVEKHYENFTGVEIPVFERVTFRQEPFFLFDSPPWLDVVITKLRAMIVFKEMLGVLGERKRALEKELREVSIRVNLFEKVLIPRILGNIKKIKIFLGDQELAAISRAKVAKKKIEGSIR
jgi:V/A-type H+/Na+-transporting ATPase subunit D